MEYPLNKLHFDIYPTNFEVTPEQDIYHCGSVSGLYNCIFTSSIDMISSLPTHHNQSLIKTCLDVTTLHPTFALHPNPLSMDCNVPHIFFTPSSSGNTSKVSFLSNFCITMDYVFLCSYTRPTIISSSMNTGANACLLVNCIVNLSPVRIRDILTTKESNIFLTFYLKTDSDKQYKFQIFKFTYSQCTNTDRLYGTMASIAQ